MAFITETLTKNAGIQSWFNALIENAVTQQRKRRIYRQTVNELSGLSNRELADLGIARSQIKSIAKETM